MNEFKYVAPEIITTGKIFIGECNINTADCKCVSDKPVTTVIFKENKKEVNVCNRCLTTMVKTELWFIPSAKV